jgi:hypothetical protein
LWIDCSGACAAGVGVLSLHHGLVALYRLPASLVWLIGSVNLLYATYSGALATRASLRASPTPRAVDLLIIANLTWALGCWAIALGMWHSASAFGRAHLVLEGLYVGALALVESRWLRPSAAS